ncbi:hypothetical protein N0614_09505 [Pseudomonas aeruginosa]|nr:hypothetical protein [Pseudomonas aeruginosa]
MRTKAVLERLIAQKEELEKTNPTAKFYERRDDSFLPIKPEDVNTSGYWKLAHRMVKSGEKPTAYVVSASSQKARWSGGGMLYTRFIPAYHISQTEEL